MEETITFQCEACGQPISVRADLVGRPVRCPHCQQEAPAPAAEPISLASAIIPTQPSPAPASDPTVELELAALEKQLSSMDHIIISEEMPRDELFDAAAALPPIDSPADSPPEPTLITTPPPANGGTAAPADSIQPDTAGEPSPFAELAGATVMPGERNPWAETSADGASALVSHPATAESSWIPTAEPGAPESRPAPRPRTRLPITLWILAILIPYSLMATTAAVVSFVRLGSHKPPLHPLESVGDRGLYENLQEGGRKEIWDPQQDLAKDAVPLKLGETRQFGGIEVTPLTVTLQPVRFSYYQGKLDHASEQEALVLRLKIKNISRIVFHPHDPLFNRAYKRDGGVYTFLTIGDQNLYGLVQDPTAERIQGQNFDELLPGHEMETLFVAAIDGERGRLTQLLRSAAKGQGLIWRIHLRKGREEILVQGTGRKRPVWVTTVIPIEFNPAQVQKGMP